MSQDWQNLLARDFHVPDTKAYGGLNGLSTAFLGINHELHPLQSHNHSQHPRKYLVSSRLRRPSSEVNRSHQLVEPGSNVEPFNVQEISEERSSESLAMFKEMHANYFPLRSINCLPKSPQWNDQDLQYPSQDKMITPIPPERQEFALQGYPMSSGSSPLVPHSAGYSDRIEGSTISCFSNTTHLHHRKRSRIEEAQSWSPRPPNTPSLSKMSFTDIPQTSMLGTSHQANDVVTMLVCRLWVATNPRHEPSKKILHYLSDLFFDTIENVRSCICFWKNIQGFPNLESTAQQAKNSATSDNYDHMRFAAYHLWLFENQPRKPSDHIISRLSELFGDSLSKIKDWFLRNAAYSSEDGINGYGTLLKPEQDIVYRYRCNQRKCNRQPDKATLEVSDSRKRYTCTSGCGKRFSDKGGWEKHEEINWPQELWICKIPACPTEPGKGRLFLRRDRFTAHVAKNHRDVYADVHAKKRALSDCCIPIQSDFGRHCSFRDCKTRFKSWKDRINHIANHFESQPEGLQWNNFEDDIESSRQSDSDSIDSKGDASNAERGGTTSDDSDDSSDNGPAPPSAGHGPDAGSYDDKYHSSKPRQNQGKGSHDHRGGGTLRGSSSYVYRSQDSNTPLAYRTLNGVFPTYKPITLRSSTIRSTGLLRSRRIATVDNVSPQGSEGMLARETNHRSKAKKDQSQMHQLSVRHIASFLGTLPTTLVMQPVVECSLLQYLIACSTGVPIIENMVDWFGNLASAIRYIHYQGILHGDIESSDIIVQNRTVLYTVPPWTSSLDDGRIIMSSQGIWMMPFGMSKQDFSDYERIASHVSALGDVYVEMFTILAHCPRDTIRRILLRSQSKGRFRRYCDTDQTAAWTLRLPLGHDQLQEEHYKLEVRQLGDSLLFSEPTRQSNAFECVLVMSLCFLYKKDSSRNSASFKDPIDTRRSIGMDDNTSQERTEEIKTILIRYTSARDHDGGTSRDSYTVLPSRIDLNRDDSHLDEKVLDYTVRSPDQSSQIENESRTSRVSSHNQGSENEPFSVVNAEVPSMTTDRSYPKSDTKKPHPRPVKQSEGMKRFEDTSRKSDPWIPYFQSRSSNSSKRADKRPFM